MKEEKVFDELLVIRCNEGDNKAFELLVKRWNKKLIGFAYRYTKDFNSAKDIVQESWISIFSAISKLKEPSKFHSWAFRITYNKIIDHFKKHQKDIDLINGSELNHSQSDDYEEINIQEYLVKLPLDHRTILTLFYLEEFSINEISDILNLPSGTVKSRIFYAREKLKKIIKQQSYENHR